MRTVSQLPAQLLQKTIRFQIESRQAPTWNNGMIYARQVISAHPARPEPSALE
ncbi:hypothetical protein PAMC26510_05335 [Caballeronia sordidicola]|uniref:Uncharacterized protein n=1 Tax=Caballeronia sordidicola TaxID=196367 RepID=A0A242N8E1_CABSO|nr:hypothetical protein PAMC26510_05335 [Caballeronia sordidicola]